MNNSLKKIRLLLEMSQAEFAHSIGKNGQSAISNYEKGFRNPDLPTAWKIIDIAFKKKGLKLTLEDIFPRKY